MVPSPDFVIGQSYADILKKNDGKIYGPNTLSIMNSLGYPTNESPGKIKLKFDPRHEMSGGMILIRNTGYYFLGFILVLLYC